ncbi:MAG TPA: Gfo/Idh/MocA family oxidoreductase [Ktedonobacteraceae bacterium]|jgi:predicted dehydrogenase|nr:Gfo/Idh/MocA family oxidoreductase [Ktedonobacteraceae bacterium]
MESSRSLRLRYAVIGVAAGIFNSHRRGLASPIVEIVAVSDIDAERGQRRADEIGCPFYTDYRQLLAGVRPDVAVILTPHPLHARIAIDCLRAGCHVLVEKPIAIQVAEADAMIAVARECGRLLGVVFQHRFRPDVRMAHRLLQAGRLGAIERVELTAVWTRPASYFHQAPWRATWAGEGGGIAMNQAMHNMDILCYLVGMPQRVYGWTRRLLHQIEVEDTIQAMLEWPGGALGTLHISTAEADVPERLKIVGTRGRLELCGGQLTFRELDQDIREYAATNPEPYGKLPSHEVALEEVALELENGAADHSAVYSNFHDAILHGSPLMVDGEQGRMSLELANAIIYSHFTHSEVELPLDRQSYAALLERLQRSSSFRG